MKPNALMLAGFVVVMGVSPLAADTDNQSFPFQIAQQYGTVCLTETQVCSVPADPIGFECDCFDEDGYPEEGFIVE